MSRNVLIFTPLSLDASALGAVLIREGLGDVTVCPDESLVNVRSGEQAVQMFEAASVLDECSQDTLALVEAVLGRCRLYVASSSNDSMLLGEVLTALGRVDTSIVVDNTYGVAMPLGDAIRIGIRLASAGPQRA